MMKFTIKRVGVKKENEAEVSSVSPSSKRRYVTSVFFGGSNSFLAMPSSKKPYKDKTERFSTQLN